MQVQSYQYSCEVQGYQSNNKKILNEFDKVISKTPHLLNLSNLTEEMCKNVPWKDLTFVKELSCYRLPLGLYENIAILTSLQKLSFKTSVKENGLNHLTSLTKLHSISLMETNENLINILLKLPQLTSIKCDIGDNKVINNLHKWTALCSLSFEAYKPLNLEGLSKCAHLQFLDISESRALSSISLQNLVKIPLLKTLVAQKVYTYNEGPSNLFQVAGQLTNLKILDLGRNFNSTDNDLVNLVHLTSLKCLNLAFNKKMTPLGIANLTSLVALEKLNISGTSVKAEDSARNLMNTLAFFTRLNLLKAEFTPLTEWIPPTLIRNQSLSKLVINSLPKLINGSEIKVESLSNLNEDLKNSIQEQQLMTKYTLN